MKQQFVWRIVSRIKITLGIIKQILHAIIQKPERESAYIVLGN